MKRFWRSTQPKAKASVDSAFAQTVVRAESLWPESTQQLGLEGQTTLMSRFDPGADERSRLQAQALAAFDLCHPALALRAVLFVQLVLALPALAGAHSLAQWAQRQAAFSFSGLLAALLWLVAMCGLRRLVARWASARRAVVMLGMGMLAAAVSWLPLVWAGMVTADGFALAAVLLTGAGLAGLLGLWLEARARTWQPVHASARLAELQSRIRPHFLFNALNSALALVRVDPAKAEAVLEDLAQLFRVALAEAGTSVSLAEELELARRYMDIEQVRFGARLAVRWDVQVGVEAARVPPLVLQPLVENAVRHGIEPSPEGGHVHISAKLQRGQVVVLVSNTLGETTGAPGHGMALHNLRERLRLLHDVGAQCDVWIEPPGKGYSGGGLFHARITLPAP